MGWDNLAKVMQTTASTVMHTDRVVVYTCYGHAPVTLTRPIYEAKGIEADVGQSLQIASTQPMLDLILTDLPAYPTERDTLTLDGVPYRVSAPTEDGQGMISLRLVRDD